MKFILAPLIKGINWVLSNTVPEITISNRLYLISIYFRSVFQIPFDNVNYFVKGWINYAISYY